MPDKLKLEIATPERLVLSLDVDDVVLPSVDGYMGVRPGHAPLLAKLQVGEVSYRVGSEEKYLALSGGFAEVLRGGVEILAETCEAAEEIDVERAERSRERAEDRLKKQATTTEFARAEASLKRAICRIQAYKHGH